MRQQRDAQAVVRGPHAHRKAGVWADTAAHDLWALSLHPEGMKSK